MFVQQTQYTIEKLVNRIRSGRLALPDFQRDFVWSPAQVADLLESIAREWPIGSLLLLNGPQPFAFRPIDSAPEVFHPDLDLYVLDGQQRVTSVYHAIQNVSPFVYYVDFNEGLTGVDEVVSWDRRARFERKYRTMDSRAFAGIALIQDIWENERFHEWLALIPNPARRNEFVGFRERRLAGLQSKVYHLLAIELEQGIELEALAKIFETLNKTGVRLNAFDLLVAKLYPTKFNLREKWDTARLESSILSKYDPDGLEIIKLIALLVRSHEGKHFSRGVRQGDVLSIDPQYVSQYWDKAVALYSQALGLMEEFGAVAGYLVPSWSMVLGLAGCIEFGFANRAREWWVARIKSQTFAQAANTRIVAEFDSLSQGHFSGAEQVNGEFAEILSLPARSNGLLLRGLTALVIELNPIDPITGKPLGDSAKVEWFELTPRGNLAKLSQTSDFSRVVFVSNEGLRHVGATADVLALPHARDSLKQQGFDLTSLQRSQSFFEDLFS
jgi:hypothetical protein